MRTIVSPRNTLLFILFIACVLRIVVINQSLWLDEATSILTAKSYSYIGLITQFAASDFHPPLYYLVLKFWTSLFGSTEIGARNLSILCGVLSVWVVYLVGNKLFGRTIGLITALLLATAPLHVYYSQEARMYSLETLLVLISVYMFTQVLEQQSVVRWLLFTFLNILLLYTDYLPTFIFIVYWLFIFYRRKSFSKQFVTYFAISQVVVIVSFLPFVPIFIRQLQLGHTASLSLWSKALGLLSVKSIALVFIKFSIGRISFSNKITYALFVAIPLTIFGALLAWPLTARSFLLRQNDDDQRHDLLGLVYFWLFVPLVVGSIIAVKLSIFDYFRFLFVLPALYLILSCAIGNLKNVTARWLLIVFVVAINSFSLFTYYTHSSFHREDWRSAVSYIESNSQRPSIVVFPNIQQADAFRYYDGARTQFTETKVFHPGEYKTIWLMRYVQDIFDPQDLQRIAIETNGYHRFGEHNFNGVVVWEYTN